MPKSPAPTQGVIHSPHYRRRYPRRSKPFQGVYYTEPGDHVPTVGLDISGGGICLLVQKPISDPTQLLTLGVMVGDKPFSVVGRVLWSNVYQVKGVDHYRYGIKLSTIADADWERLMHWILDGGAGTAPEGSHLTDAQRDELLASEVQSQIAEALVERERLDPPGAGRAPRIEYVFERYTMRLGTPYMAFRLHTRHSDLYKRTIEEHDTRILVGCEDGRLKVLD